MVSVGFICEGESDSILYQSETFYKFLEQLNIRRISVINSKGGGNLLPHNIAGYIDSLEKQGAEKIVIITDLDDAPCITLRKEQIDARPEDVVIIAVKELEAWFLADSITMKRLLRLQHFTFQLPEEELEPLDTINNLLTHYTGKGIGKSGSAKSKLAKRMLNFGFDFYKAADHPNCPSARYLINKLKQIGNN